MELMDDNAQTPEQATPDPDSRIITPSEVAIAFASGSLVSVPVAPELDPDKTGEIPVVKEEDTQMPELFKENESPEPQVAIPEPAQQTSAVFPEGVVAFTEPAPATEPAYGAQAFTMPAALEEPEPSTFATATFEGTSPIPMAIDEVAQEAVQAANQENINLATAEVLAAEQGFAAVANEIPLEVEEEPIERGITVITKEATVLGDILTEGHIDVVGRVKGNIDAKGDVAIHGIVRGDVDGAKIGLYNCRVKGNLDAGLGVIVDDNSIIGGDVKTKNIIFDGKVKGNIEAENVVVLRSHSYCLGDVSAASLAIEPGAVLNGKVRTLVEGDLEAPFFDVI